MKGREERKHLQGKEDTKQQSKRTRLKEIGREMYTEEQTRRVGDAFKETGERPK